MLILAFETSAKAAGVAVHDGVRLLAESYQYTDLTHSRTLLVMAQDALRQCEKTVHDVTHVAVAAGPGSFTGVRIGVAAAKGFAWGAELPCIGVSTLEAMAKGFGLSDGIVCAVMDARRAQVYNALFRMEKGVCTRLCPDRAIALEALCAELQGFDEPIFLVGDGSRLTYDTLCALVPDLRLPPEHRAQQRGAGVALAALDAVRAGECGDAEQLQPNYLRLSQAEREKSEKISKEK